MMMRAQVLLMKNPAADERQIRAWLEPNLTDWHRDRTDDYVAMD